ncbi:MAG: hypothetical protein ACPGVA_16815 [Pikeienuella sp.]
MSLNKNTALARIAGPKIRKLARQGKLIDQAFKEFRTAAFPNATQDQIHLMRVCFFAGSAEVHALTMYGLEEGSEPTDADYQFMSDWVAEVELFHERTIATMLASGTPQ